MFLFLKSTLAISSGIVPIGLTSTSVNFSNSAIDLYTPDGCHFQSQQCIAALSDLCSLPIKLITAKTSPINDTLKRTVELLTEHAEVIGFKAQPKILSENPWPVTEFILLCTAHHNKNWPYLLLIFLLFKKKPRFCGAF
ncbi:hypothetical protein ACJJID_02670 [Microbulbifer sp. CnH-101-G]|uniref:hypothetical protein n=1 Tax=Microbulbifer sp. CnH-101-G TaxID=3243393 RepID=UPI004039EF48